MKPAKIALPPGVVTCTFPDDPLATTAVTVVALTGVKEDAAVPPKLAAVTPVKFVPVMVTVVPVLAGLGLIAVTVGAGINVKPARIPIPCGEVTCTLPLAPPATIAAIVDELTTVKEDAAVPPKLTAVAPVKFVPVMVTVVPLPAGLGVNEVIVGAFAVLNVKPPSTRHMPHREEP